MGFRLTYNLALPGVFCRFHTVINLFFFKPGLRNFTSFHVELYDYIGGKAVKISSLRFIFFVEILKFLAASSTGPN